MLGSSTGPVFGAGIEVRIVGRVFVQAAVERFQETGQRVFVSNGQVFDLGIADTVRVIPVSVTAGYRRDFRTFASYFGIAIAAASRTQVGASSAALTKYSNVNASVGGPILRRIQSLTAGAPCLIVSTCSSA